ncbi:MAG: methyltransferase domain-containing protein [Bdellovibrionia bacterium]
MIQSKSCKEQGQTPAEPTFCSYFNRGECRSCNWIEQEYLGQLEKKENKIKEALSFFPAFQLEKSIKSPLQGFRNRAKMIVTGSVEKPVIGLLGEETLDQGRELLSCPIHHKKLNQIIAALPEIISTYNLIPYRIYERKGELKGLILFYSPETNQSYLRFILRSKECVARIKKLVPGFQKQFPEVVCITANIQPIPHAIQEGPEEIFLTEVQSIDLQLGAIRLKLAPQAFVQTNIHVATELYQTAARWIGEAQRVCADSSNHGRAAGKAHFTKILELFCGQGAFSLIAAHTLEGVAPASFLGIEINPEAVRTANDTAMTLGLSQVRFKASDATQVFSDIESFQPDLILVNPPRRGLGDGVKTLKKIPPSHLIYSSCSIRTLAADLKVLAGNYHLKKVQLFDMFPHTEHFETLIWLERNS